MNEQQRVFTAVLLCVGIFVVWQIWFPPKEMPARTQTQSAAPSPPTTPPPVVAGVVANNVGQAVAPQEPPMHRPFATDVLQGEVSNLTAGLTRVQLLNYRERGSPGEEAPLLSMSPHDSQGQAQIIWTLGDSPQPAMRFSQPDGLALAGQSATGFRVSVDVIPRAHDYALDYVVRATNSSNAAQRAGAAVSLALAEELKDNKGLSFFRGSGVPQLQGFCDVDGSVTRKEMSSVAEKPWTSVAPARFAGIDRQYFVVAMLPAQAGGGRCEVSKQGNVLRVDYSLGEETIQPGATWEKRFTVYIGPKHDTALAAVAPVLTDTIDYNIWHLPLGFLARPMVYLLNVFHNWTASWGIAIALLTLLVKTVLFPFTYKSVISMRRMQELKPELDRLKSQFEKDRERLQVEQMKLYREKGVNPLGGCLPTLLQMPVWIALYRTLLNAVDLYRQSFLWLPDLTAKEPFPFLALVLGVITLVQQKITPMAVDNQQAKVMMYVMPVMFTVFMVALPSGLVLYILVNAILTIVQQLAINRRAVSV